MTYGPEWREAKGVALIRDGGRCAICGWSTTEVHHRDPQGMGGSTNPDRHSPAKLVTLCRIAHDRVERSHRGLAFDLGYLLRDGYDPAEVPVWYAVDSAWYWLSESGVRVPFTPWRGAPPTALPRCAA